MSKIGLMYNSSVDLQQFVKNVKINIIKNILGDKFALFQKLAKENKTLFSFILEYWNGTKGINVRIHNINNI